MLTFYHLISVDEKRFDSYEDFNDAACEDYATHFLYHPDNETSYYLEDNIHGNPETFADGFFAGLRMMDAPYCIKYGIVPVPGGCEYSYDAIKANLDKVKWDKTYTLYDILTGTLIECS